MPPHERVWRHPSEIGAAMSLDLSTHRPPTGIGRGLLVAAGLVGITVSVVMIQLLRPERPNVSAGPATSVSPMRPAPSARATAVRAETTVVTTLVGDTAAMHTSAPVTVPTSTTAATATTSPRPVTTTVLVMVPVPPAPVMSVVDLDRVAVPIASGDYAITLADGLDVRRLVTLEAPDGGREPAVVVATGSDLALLARAGSSQGAMTAPLPEIGDVLAIETSEGDEMVTGEAVGEGGLTVRIHGTIAAGSPLRTVDGAVAALGRPAPDGSISLVPVSLVGDLIARAAGTGGWLGITGRMHSEQGATVDNVQAGSPAEAAGIRPGDVIVGLDGQPVASIAELVVRLRAYEPGGAVNVTVHRDEGDTQLTVQLVARPVGTAQPPMSAPGTTVSVVSDAPQPSAP